MNPNKHIYAIGDVQGCYDALCRLLDKIEFDSSTHEIWFVGDLINRGPHSLKTLRLIKSLGENATCVLGNHDFYLLALHYDIDIHSVHTLDEILQAPDREALIDWLLHRPLLHHAHEHTMVHAGIPPQWGLAQAQALAKEVETVLQAEPKALLETIYGDEPRLWCDTLQSYEKYRCVINYFTRMRCIQPDGTLLLNFKGPLNEIPDGYLPWFRAPKRNMQHQNIIFGHWASLMGQANTPYIFAIDTGCVWGHALTALHLTDHQTISVASRAL